MVLRIALKIGIPLDLFRENHFAIDHGSCFAVAAPKVEPDPASVQMPSDRPRAFAGRGQCIERHANHFERLPVGSFSHEGEIEFSRSAWGIQRGDGGGNARFPTEKDPASAALPEEKLRQPLDIEEIESFGIRIGCGQDRSFVNRDIAAGLFQGDAEAAAAGGSTRRRKARFHNAAGRNPGSSGGGTGIR